MEKQEELQDVIRKLDVVIEKLDRLTSDVEKHSAVLHGEGSSLGLIQRVSILWRSYIWVLCTASAGMGFLLNSLISKVWGLKL